jgi:hypothetical protein
MGERSYELKLSRAQHHLEGCERAIDDWIKGARETVVEEADPEHPGTHGAWIDPDPLPANEIGLLVGDCLQCFRTTLDHLAFELASAFTKPLTDEIEKDSEFPIIGDRNKVGLGAGPQMFASSGSRKIRGIDPAAQTVIKGLQPYHRGQAFTDDPLWRLHELNRLDKHRVLHVIAASVEGFSWTPGDAENVSLTVVRGFLQGVANPVEGRTQVARWRSDTFDPIDPDKDMRMNFRPTLHVGFAPTTPVVGGAPVLDVLREIDDHIVSDVLPPLVGFLK